MENLKEQVTLGRYNRLHWKKFIDQSSNVKDLLKIIQYGHSFDFIFKEAFEKYEERITPSIQLEIVETKNKLAIENLARYQTGLSEDICLKIIESESKLAMRNLARYQEDLSKEVQRQLYNANVSNNNDLAIVYLLRYQVSLHKKIESVLLQTSEKSQYWRKILISNRHNLSEQSLIKLGIGVQQKLF